MPASVPNAIFTPAFTAFAKFSRCASFVISVFCITSSEYPSRGPSWIIQSPSNMSAHEVRPVLEHQIDGLVVDQASVLDRADAGADRPVRTLRAVRVRGDVAPAGLGFLDRGPDLFLGQLGLSRVRAGRQHGARRDHLDEVRAGVEDPDARSRAPRPARWRRPPGARLGTGTSGGRPVMSPPPPGQVT